METHNQLKQKVQHLYTEIQKGHDTPELRQSMSQLSQSEHLTTGQRGALNYYSNAHVSLDKQSQADFKQLVYDMDTRSNIMLGDVIGQMKTLEPMVQFKGQGYEWGVNLSDLGQIRLDKAVYNTVGEAQAQADSFTALLGKNALKPWISLGMNYWVGSKDLSHLKPFQCRAEILNIRGKQFLVLYELWDTAHQNSIQSFQKTRTNHFTKRVQQLQDMSLFPQWSMRGFVPTTKSSPTTSMGMFYVGYSFMNSNQIDMYSLSKKLQNILCE